LKKLLLERKPSTATECEGFLSFNNELLTTIERPWIEHVHPGGKPFESCVPVGTYRIIYHTRKNGDVVPALINEELGVYYTAEERDHERGRYLILIHIGNWVEDVVGCIAPGLAKGDSHKGPMVKGSKAAMQKIMDYLDGDDAILEIKWIH
jgi:hypothetical protein